MLKGGISIYKNWSTFKKPKGNTKIWRYLDFTKFISILESRELHFTRVDKFYDKFEGSGSKPYVQKRDEGLKKLGEAIYRIMKPSMSRFYKEFRKFVFVNCWDIKDYESAAMWNLYLKSNEGVAIQSTFNKLKTSFKDDKENAIFIGKVKYIDYSKDFMNCKFFFEQALYKRKSFSHENELRLMTLRIPIKLKNGKIIVYDYVSDFQVKIGSPYYEGNMFENGVNIPTNLDILIEKIYVSPTAPEWFFNLVIGVLRFNNL